MVKESTLVNVVSQQRSRDSSVHPHRFRLLIVEDMDENLQLLTEVFEENGFVALGARTGREALEILADSHVDLVVADAMMPTMDGFQLCREIRADHRYDGVPLVIYTGNYIDTADQEFAARIGVDRYVVKTGGVAPLLDAVRELVNERYGSPNADGEASSRIDEHAFLEQHRAVVIRKLEEKMTELEEYTGKLERKNRELQASEARYRALFDHASVAICVADQSTGRVLDANRRALELFRYTREGLQALPRLPFLDQTTLPAAGDRSGAFFTGETAIVTSDGEVRRVDVGMGPMTDSDNVRVVLYIRDITDRVQMQEQLLQADKMSLMGRIAAGIAHEIRNPLSAITLNLQYLLQRENPDPVVEQSIRDALEATQRVATVVERTLGLARISPGVVREEDVSVLVRQAMDFVKLSLRQKHVRVEHDLSDALPHVIVDPSLIHQVILNIVQNAIDASPEGGVVTVSTGQLSRVSEAGVPWTTITVEDRGPGIPIALQKRLFEHFYTTKPGGTGLGLTLSKQIMMMHNGDIRVESEPRRGTKVTMLFPPTPDERGRH